MRSSRDRDPGRLAALQRRQGRGVHARRHATSSTPRSWKGRREKAGAVAGVTIKQSDPRRARGDGEVEHVMMVGRGAELFAAQMGWRSSTRRTSGPSALEVAAAGAAQGAGKRRRTTRSSAPSARWRSIATGNLAAGTSTGGMTNKQYGRVGDAPIIGAGTYARTSRARCPATGHGEFFIRWTVAHDIGARVQYRGITARRPADEVVHKKLVRAGRRGRRDHPRPPRATSRCRSTARGCTAAGSATDGVPHVEIYKAAP